MADLVDAWMRELPTFAVKDDNGVYEHPVGWLADRKDVRALLTRIAAAQQVLEQKIRDFEQREEAARYEQRTRE